MKMEVNFSAFCDAFRSAGRQDQFSYAAKRAIFNALEELDPDYTLDVIEICCDYVESDIETVKQDYDETSDMSDEGVLEYLNDNTVVISESPLVYVAF